METIAWYRYEGCMNDSEGVGVEMERLAASMGGTSKFPYNDSECLDADFFKVPDFILKPKYTFQIFDIFRNITWISSTY